VPECETKFAVETVVDVVDAITVEVGESDVFSNTVLAVAGRVAPGVKVAVVVTLLVVDRKGLTRNLELDGETLELAPRDSDDVGEDVKVVLLVDVLE